MPGMNSLCDKEIIAALYEAGAAGVKIELIIRGICCLKTGIPGISENISVRSIVGNFLEHARIFYFLNDGQEEIYMGSADWMPRNLDKRVEILFPVEWEKRWYLRRISSARRQWSGRKSPNRTRQSGYLFRQNQ